MKKLLLLTIVAVSAIFSSCQSDNDSDPTPAPSNFMKTNLNGVNVNYDVISTSLYPWTDLDGENHTDLTVTASRSDDESKSISFSSEYLRSGTDAVFSFTLNDGEFIWDTENPQPFVIDIIESTANKVKGTFSGTINNGDGTSSAVITNGTFDIKF